MSCEQDRCITCGDIAVEMTVLCLDPDGTLALCEADDGARETIDVTLVAPIAPAERLLAHAGTAISRQGDGA